MQRRPILIVAAGLLLSLLCVASASAKTLKPSGQAVAHRVGPGFFEKGPSTGGAPRVHPLHPEHPTRLDHEKQKLARQITTGAPQAPLAPASVSAQWNGLVWSDNTTFLGTPPDTTGAIGPSQYFEFVNSVVSPYNTTSPFGSLGNTQLDVFAGPTGRSVFDPQIQWDESAGRWIYSAISDDGDTNATKNFIVFGWSKTSDPSGDFSSGNWCNYAIVTGTAIDDYDKLGHDGSHILIGSNVYTGNTFNGARIWALPKPANGSTDCPNSFGIPFFGYNGTAGSGLKTADGGAAFTPVPANTVDPAPTGGKGYVVAADDPTDQGGTANQLMVWHIENTPADPTLVQDGNISVGDYSVPANIPQPGRHSPTLDSLDARLTQAVENPDPDATPSGAEALWTQHTINDAINAPGGRSVVRWYELIPGGNCNGTTCTAAAERQEGNVSSTTDFIFNGAISPTKTGNSAMIDYNAGSSADLVSIHVASRKSGDTTGMMPNDSQLIPSTVIDNDFSCGGPFTPCRWGDYAGASPDPLNPGLVWGSSQYNIPPGTTQQNPNQLTWQTYNFAVAP